MSQTAKNFIFIALIAAGIVLSQYYAARFNRQRETLVGQKAPDFESESVSETGQSLALKNLVGKKVLLINIWATWCAPCREEMPVLNAIHNELNGDSFQIISLMEDDARSIEELNGALAKFKNKIPVNFPVYRDKDGMIADLYGTYKIPETFVIDKMGYVAAHHAGGLTESDKERLTSQIRAFIEAK